jgi:signal transduction histidine kinase/CheY-like chemotaxis protein
VPANDISAAVGAQQLRAIFRQLPIALAVNLVNAALVVIVLNPISARPLPLVWFLAVILVTAGRWMLWRGYRRADHIGETRFWALGATCGSLLAGLCWGIGGALLFPIIPAIGQIFLTFVVGGMCTGAVVLSAPHLPSLLAFLLSASLPMAARFFGGTAATDSAVGTMILVFAAALSLAGIHLNRFFAEAMRLRFELNEANLRLQDEIAEHGATEAALRQAQKLEAIGHLTGGIAHDFNNLLTVVIGNLTLAIGRAGETPAIVPLLQSALRGAERGVALIQRLLSFGRQQRLEPRAADLKELIVSIEELLRRTLGPQIHLSVTGSPSLAPARVDTNQLELAILNLTINARDAMPKGGSMRIGIHNQRTDRNSPAELAPGDYVVVSISDTGTGMDETTLARAFDPFFTTKEVGSGSGLGLPMVQGFAAQSGGAVRMASTLGVGTTVELWLPQAGEPPSEAFGQDRHGAELPRGAANILLCDDDDDVRRFLSVYLNSTGYAVREASGPDAALRILEDTAEVELLIVDYAMPGMNGLETIRQAWKRRPDLKALLVTGQVAALPDAAGVPFLRKPFTPADLAQKLTEILAH